MIELIWLERETLLDPTSAFIYVAARTMKKMFRRLRCSTWFPLLAIAGGAVVAIVVLKLMALFGAAFDISFLRDVGTNIPPGAAAAGGAAGGGWWGNNPPPLGFLYVSSPNGVTLHQDPSTASPSVGTAPHGSRAIYDSIQEINGQDWCRILTPGEPGVTRDGFPAVIFPLLARRLCPG